MNLGDYELFNWRTTNRIGEKLINSVDKRKIFLKLTRKELVHRIFNVTCELN